MNNECHFFKKKLMAAKYSRFEMTAQANSNTTYFMNVNYFIFTLVKCNVHIFNIINPF